MLFAISKMFFFFILMIDFAVQVSHKPKGIAVGAAKERVHIVTCFFFLRSENLRRAKSDDAGTVA